MFNVQVARNVATGLNERDSILTALQLGRITKKGDTSFLYVFTIKGANSLISQVTDDDLGTGTGVNIRTNHFRFEYGIAKKVTFQSLFFIQNSIRSSGQFPNFFVPLEFIHAANVSNSTADRFYVLKAVRLMKPNQSLRFWWVLF